MKKTSIKFFFSASAVLLLYTGCLKNEKSEILASESEPTEGLSKESLEKWNAYSDALQGNSIPKDCRPKRFGHTGSKFSGVVVLFHGYTACPQGLFELAEKYLAPAGFDVLLPLNPGHGREPHLEPGKFKFDELPTNETEQNIERSV